MAADAQSDSIAAEGAAMASLAIGLMAMFTWVIPLVGLAVPTVGLIVGRRGLASRFEGRALAGIVLCILGLGLNLLLWHPAFFEAIDS